MMEKELKLFKNNEKKDWSDLEWINEFYDFLQGEIPEGISLRRGRKPKLSPKKHLRLFGTCRNISLCCRTTLKNAVNVIICSMRKWKGCTGKPKVSTIAAIVRIQCL